MRIEYDIAAASIIGTREDQQDDYFYKMRDGQVIAAVCDGMGGLTEGALSSIIAVNTIDSLYEKKKKEQSFYDFFYEAIDVLDESVSTLPDKMNNKEFEPGTTIVAVGLQENKLHWLGIGDSRIYVVRNNEIVQVTRDHNYFMILNEAFEKGEIDSAQYREEQSMGQALISFLGMGGVEAYDLNSTPLYLEDGDTVLLMSDGLYQLVSESDMVTIVNKNKSANQIVEKLIRYSEEKKKTVQDNTTVIVIKCIMEV